MKQQSINPELLTDGYREQKLDELSDLVKRTPLQDVPEVNYTPKRSVWNRILDFLRGRNRSGKVFHTVVATGLGITAGINIDPILSILQQGGIEPMDVTYIEIILMAVTGLVGFLISRQLIKGFLQEILEEVRDIAVAVQQSRAADSPGGTSLTDEEKLLIQKEIDDLVTVLYKRLLRSRIVRLFGVHTKQDPSGE